MEERIIEILKNVLETENVNTETSQKNCEKWDSIHHLSIVVEIEDTFGITLEPEDIVEMKSVRDIINIINSK